MTNCSELARAVSEFAKEREWDEFHPPKNLAMALSVEAVERLGVDIPVATAAQIKIDRARYPVEKSRGNAQKCIAFDAGSSKDA